FEALVEEVVVPETWFFRGAGLFTDLAKRIRNTALSRPFRVLSVPCSTGEEPYSLAIALAEANVSPQAFTLEGVDLSGRSVERAQRGCYGAFSFRQTDPGLHDRYFRPAGREWEIDATLRQAVRFRTGNLVDPQFLWGEAPYDLILCRNLLIYLHPEARR